MTNVVAVVFAHNEEKPLSLTLQILNKYKAEGRIQKIVVINDGSTDKTRDVAEKAGVIVINHKKNLGKREGFISGAIQAKKLGAEVMLTFDADLCKFPRNTLNQMVETVTSGKKLMSIAQQHELHPLDGLGESSKVIDIHSNAQRAINMDALEPLFRGNSKWMQIFKTTKSSKPEWLQRLKTIKLSTDAGQIWEILNPTTYKDHRLAFRWGLEYALDTLIPKNKIVRLDAPIGTLAAYRKFEASPRTDIAVQQNSARKNIQDLIHTRRQKAQQIKGTRKKRGLTGLRRIR